MTINEESIKVIKTRDTSKKRQTILKGAIEVFTEVGYKEASMDRIAKVSNTSKNTIYSHFKSKENLFQEIIVDFLGKQQVAKNIEYNHETSLKEQLIMFVNAEMYLINDPERRRLSRLLTSVFIMDISYSLQTRAKFGSPQQKFIEWLEAAKEDMRLSVESTEKAARIFYGMIEGIMNWPALFSNGISLKDSDEMIMEIVDVFLSKYKNQPTIEQEKE